MHVAGSNLQLLFQYNEGFFIHLFLKIYRIALSIGYVKSYSMILNSFSDGLSSRLHHSQRYNESDRSSPNSRASSFKDFYRKGSSSGPSIRSSRRLHRTDSSLCGQDLVGLSLDEDESCESTSSGAKEVQKVLKTKSAHSNLKFGGSSFQREEERRREESKPGPSAPALDCSRQLSAIEDISDSNNRSSQSDSDVRAKSIKIIENLLSRVQRFEEENGEFEDDEQEAYYQPRKLTESLEKLDILVAQQLQEASIEDLIADLTCDVTDELEELKEARCNISQSEETEDFARSEESPMKIIHSPPRSACVIDKSLNEYEATNQSESSKIDPEVYAALHNCNPFKAARRPDAKIECEKSDDDIKTVPRECWN